MSIFGTLEIGRSALRAQHKGMETSGQNVANANTPGYSRQRVDLESSVPGIAPGVDMAPGRGVEVSDVTRLKNEYFHQQMMDAGSQRAHWEKRQENITSLENIMREPGDQGLNQYMGEFFDSWNELSSEPEENAIRQSLLEHAETLTNAFEDNYRRMEDLQGEVYSEIEMYVDDINEVAEEVAELNEKLTYLHNVGRESNELRDHLEHILEDLSEKIDLDIHYQEGGAATVYAGNRLLVHGDQVQEFSVEQVNNAEEGNQEEGDLMQIVSDRGRPVEVASGEIKGMLEAANEIIPNVQEGLNDMARAMAEEINGIHENAYGLDGETGRPFFQELDEDSDLPPALQLEVNPAVRDDPDAVAASSTEEGVPGAGDAALNISKVRDEGIITGGENDEGEGATLEDHYRGIVSALGVEGRESERMVDAMKQAEEEFREQNESVAGVNIDEEMLDMMQFQHAWHGASRFLNHVDQMIETLFMELG